MQFKDYFSNRSNDYAIYPPKYPKNLVKTLSNLAPSNTTVLDCGCGTGQLSVLLSENFDNVIATDASKNQIENAEARLNITYKVSRAEENTDITDQSVDLITVAQAAHWLNLPVFYSEAQRILKPSGLVALITYGVIILSDKIPNEIIRNFYYNTLASYWPPERKLVESGYKTLDFPFKEIEFPTVAMHALWNFNELFGYISTWSAFKELEKSGGIDKIAEFYQDLQKAWGNLNDRKDISWPISGRIGKKF